MRQLSKAELELLEVGDIIIEKSGIGIFQKKVIKKTATVAGFVELKLSFQNTLNKKPEFNSIIINKKDFSEDGIRSVYAGVNKLTSTYYK